MARYRIRERKGFYNNFSYIEVDSTAQAKRRISSGRTYLDSTLTIENSETNEVLYEKNGKGEWMEVLLIDCN